MIGSKIIKMRPNSEYQTFLRGGGREQGIVPLPTKSLTVILKLNEIAKNDRFGNNWNRHEVSKQWSSNLLTNRVASFSSCLSGEQRGKKIAGACQFYFDTNNKTIRVEN